MMNTIDPVKAAQVWQRVQGERPAGLREDVLLELIARESEDAEIYLQLSRKLQGRAGALLRKMYEQEQAHAACLRGIYTLTTGKRAGAITPRLTPDTPEHILRRCYGREMRCLARYEQRINDPEYGQVFSRLAEQERDHCRMILELLGGLLTK